MKYASEVNLTFNFDNSSPHLSRLGGFLSHSRFRFWYMTTISLRDAMMVDSSAATTQLVSDWLKRKGKQLLDVPVDRWVVTLHHQQWRKTTFWMRWRTSGTSKHSGFCLAIVFDWLLCVIFAVESLFINSCVWNHTTSACSHPHVPLSSRSFTLSADVLKYYHLSTFYLISVYGRFSSICCLWLALHSSANWDNEKGLSSTVNIPP